MQNFKKNVQCCFDPLEVCPCVYRDPVLSHTSKNPAQFALKHAI